MVKKPYSSRGGECKIRTCDAILTKTRGRVRAPASRRLHLPAPVPANGKGGGDGEEASPTRFCLFPLPGKLPGQHNLWAVSRLHYALRVSDAHCPQLCTVALYTKSTALC